MSFDCKHWVVLCVLFAGVISYRNTVSASPSINDDPPGFWDPIWTYSCSPFLGVNSCQRLLSPYNSSDSNAPPRVSSKVCWLTCGEHGALWPYPTIRTELGSDITPFLPTNIRLSSVISPNQNVTDMVQEAVNITFGHINKMYELGLIESPFPVNPNKNNPRAKNGELNRVELALWVLNPDTKVNLNTDESYTFLIQKEQNGPDDPVVIKVYITGITYFGLRHGLETFTQLIAYDEDTEFLQIVNQVDIADKPAYRFRGMSIDTGRNFIPFEDLRRMVDGMAFNKLNMFHWHLSDSNSIPFMSKRVPQVTKYGAYGQHKVYRPEDITEFIRYANIRGIKVIPELDAPSHAGIGWEWGPLEGLGELSLCVNAEPYAEYCIQPPCGQLNPINNNTLDVLGKLFQDFLDVFDRDLFHMGNDEVSEKCWLKYPELTEWIDQQNSSIMGLWGYFQTRSLQKLKDANEGQPLRAIVWTSDMTVRGRQYLPPDDYTIHIWSEKHESSMRDIFLDGYDVIMSNKDVMYLDHGYGPWRGNVSNVKLNYWQEIYAYDLLEVIASHVGTANATEMLNNGKVWGGLAALWSEKVDRQNMEMKLWPRGAAAAERLWSNPTQEPRRAYARLILHRERLIQRGLQPDTLLPESCAHVLGFCDNNW